MCHRSNSRIVIYPVVFQFCSVFFPAWVAWMLLGYQSIRPMIPVISLLLVVNTFFYIFVPIYAWNNGTTSMTWLDWPAVGLYALQTLLLALFMRYQGRGWVFAGSYVLLITVAGVTRMLQSTILFAEYTKSESNKILVVLIYHPVSTFILLRCTRMITLHLISLTPSESPESSRWYTIYAAFHLALQVTGRCVAEGMHSSVPVCRLHRSLSFLARRRFYLFNVSSLGVQVATCIMSNILDFNMRISRVVRTRKMWSLVASPKLAEQRALASQSHPYLLHVQYLSQSLEVSAVFIAFVAALLVRVRYDVPLPVGVVVSSFFIQLALEMFFITCTTIFEISLLGFSNRARLFVEHQAQHRYFWAAMKAIVVVPMMCGVWVSVISAVGR